MLSPSESSSNTKLISVALLAMLVAASSSAQFIWINPAGGSTGVASNWSTGIPPSGTSGAQDVHVHSLNFPTPLAILNMPLTINNWIVASRFFTRSNVTLGSNGYLSVASGTSTITGSFTMTGSTFEGSGNMAVSGLTSISGGTLNGTGLLQANGGVRIHPAISTIRKSIDASGNSTWESGTIYNDDQRPFRNLGSMQVTGGVEWWNTPWTNVGTLTKSGSNDSKFTTGLFSNQGQVTVQSGTLTLESSPTTGQSGDFDIAAGATLRLRGNTRLLGSASVNGAGTLFADAGTVTWGSGASVGAVRLQGLNGSFIFEPGSVSTFNPSVSLTSSSVVQNASELYFASITGSGSILTANAPIVVAGSMSFGGTIQGPSGAWIGGSAEYTGGQILPGASLTAQGGLQLTTAGTKDIRRDVTQQNTSSWTAGAVFSLGTFTNGGTWNVSADSEWGSTGTIQNTGTLNRNSGGGVARFSGVTFINQGTVNANSGTLRIDKSSVGGHSGIFNVGTSGSLSLFNGATFNNGSGISGAGNFRGTYGTYLFQSGSSFAPADAIAESATIRLVPGATVSGAPRINLIGSTYEANLGVPSTLGAVTGNGNFTVGSPTSITGIFDFSGSVRGNGTIQVQGLATFSSGQFQPGGRFTASGGMNLTGTGTKDFQRDITFASNSSWSGGPVFGTGGTYVNNGSFQIGGDLTWQGGTWTNTGAMAKASGSGTTLFTNLTTFANNGTVSVASGTMEIAAGGSHTGRFTTSPSTTLRLNGSHNMNGGSRLEGAGQTHISNGTTNFQSGSTLGADLSVYSSTVNFNSGAIISPGSNLGLFTSSAFFNTGSPQTLLSVNVSNSNLSTNQPLTTTDLSTFSSGQFVGTGSLNFNGGINLVSDSIKAFELGFSMGSASSWTGGSVNMAAGKIVQSSGEFTVSSSAQWSGGVFNNLGSLRKIGGAVTRMGYPVFGESTGGAQFSNSGTVTVEGGTLQLGGWGSHFGDFAVQSGATLTFNSPGIFRSGSQTSGAGTVRFESGVSEFTSGSSFQGNLIVDGADVNFLAGSSYTAPLQMRGPVTGRLNLSTGAEKLVESLEVVNGTLTGEDNIRVSGLAQLKGGIFSGAGSLILPPGSSAVINTPASKQILRPVTAQGKTQFSQGTVLATGSNWNNVGEFEFLGDLPWLLGNFTNAGLVTKLVGTNTASFSPALLSNTGTIRSESGTLAISNLSNLDRNSRRLNDGTFESTSGGVLKFNDISNGLLINDATLKFIGPGSNLVDSSGQPLLRAMQTNLGNVIVDQGANISLPAAFSNLGTLQVLDGTVSLMSPVSIGAGSVKVDGELSSPQVNISGGALSGSGLVESTVQNNGELNAGDGIGTLTLNGNYNQSSVGLLRTEIEGTLPNSADKLQVEGNVTLGGNLVIDAPGALFIPPQTRYRIVESSGTLSGTFATVPPPSVWAVVYGPNYVEVVRQGTGNVATISGRVILSQFSYVNGMRQVQLSLRQGANVVQSANVFPASNGTWSYSFQTDLTGSYEIVAGSAGFLSQAQPIAITQAGLTNINFTLVNGDADGSGEVDAADIDLVISGFGAVSGDGTYSPNIDPDNSHEVDAADIDIVIGNFGAVGD